VPRTLSLTFDDGPDELWSARVLEVLAQLKTRGTFFMVGERVREAPAAARAVVEAGHDVQLHCDRHVRHTQLSELELELDTCEALDAFAQIGVSPDTWRTPWGIRTDASERVAKKHRLRLVGWTIDTHDWRGDRAAEMLSRARPQLAPESVVLMHDGLGPGALRSGCENTVELLAPLVAAARSKGLEVGAL
jgi:peptidoglycan/xylan/chitin deacetylase (PgdA/CDA1 family)